MKRRERGIYIYIYIPPPLFCPCRGIFINISIERIGEKLIIQPIFVYIFKYIWYLELVAIFEHFRIGRFVRSRWTRQIKKKKLLHLLDLSVMQFDSKTNLKQFIIVSLRIKQKFCTHRSNFYTRLDKKKKKKTYKNPKIGTIRSYRVFKETFRKLLITFVFTAFECENHRSPKNSRK